MHERYYKYFWTGVSPLPSHKKDDIGRLSPEYKLRRILEYASFPDMVKYPFVEFKNNIHKIRTATLWTDHKRRLLLYKLLPYVNDSESWEELFEKFIQQSRYPQLKNYTTLKSQ